MSPREHAAAADPPAVLRLAADPVRWQLLTELARSDRRVQELAALTGRAHNAVSYHLGQLRAAGLVSARRSAADSRDSYYRADLPRLRALLGEACRALHPGLDGQAPGLPAGRPVARLLFACTGNSARSQMAQALAVQMSAGRVEAVSAGSHPKPLHPAAVRVMAEYGVDLRGRQPTHLSVFAADQFDYVITLCDKVREVCPQFPGHAGYIHWSIPDPSAAGGGEEATLAQFRAVAADIQTRLRYFLAGLAVPAAAS